MPYIEHDGTTRELTQGETLVGSGSQAGWRLQNVDLAARHFTLGADATGARLTPLSSQHVVVINGRQVEAESTTLADGDVIEAGSARFRYLADLNRPRSEMPSPNSEKAYLVDENERTAYPLEKKSVSVGRDAASHILVRDPSVSRFHADIRREAGQYVLYSMGSTGTTLNGLKVPSPRVLQDGDRVQVGESTFAFTRGPLPGGIRRGQLGAGSDDDKATRRDTVVYQSAVTGEGGATRVGKSPLTWVVIGAAVAAAVVAFVMLLR